MWLLVPLVVVAVLYGPTIAAYLIVPPEVLAAWPAMLVTAIPASAALVACVVLHGWRPQLEAPLTTTAAAWLQAEIARLGKVGIKVAAMAAGRNEASFFHPASNTIVLADDVFGEHSANAHATAAHELGHALFCLERPGLAALFMTARTTSRRWFQTGAGLVLGAYLVGCHAVAIVAVACLAVAAVLQALTVVEEAVASQHALDLLRPHLTSPEQAPAAARDLRRALATYGLQLLGTAGAVALAAWSWMEIPTGGVLLDGPVLGGAGATAATVTAVIGGLVALATIASLIPAHDATTGLLAALLQLVGVITSPLLTALLCDQAGAPCWTIALAVAPAWTMMSVPATLVLRRLIGWFDRDLARATVPLPTGAAIRRIDREQLVERQTPRGRLRRLPAALASTLSVPLALWWLLR